MTLSHFRGCLLGLAAGDALGTTLEFKPPGTFRPLTDMVGGGPFGLKPGQWTDDTSMALCLAESVVERGFDPLHQDDADTTGAVFGQLAGAYYGEDAIPAEWRAKLARRELIEQRVDELFNLAVAGTS